MQFSAGLGSSKRLISLVRMAFEYKIRTTRDPQTIGALFQSGWGQVLEEPLYLIINGVKNK